MKRDAIDFANEPVEKVFRRMFFPVLIGMISMVVLNITDGAFVGHGAGSDALAAINIVAPVFMISSGLGLMLGIGSSVVASIHLSKGNTKAANINLTQATFIGSLFGLILSTILFCFQKETCRLFGCSDLLMPYACDYLQWVAWIIPFNVFGMVTMYMVRLDGSPKFAMWVNTSIAILNIILDYTFIFPCKLGIEGAAMATSISFALGNIPVFIYIIRYSNKVKFYRLKMTWMSFKLTCRNIAYQLKLGFSGFLGEIAMASTMILGNYIFIQYLGEDGVAAYSVCCYCIPIVFMVGSAVLQSVQPIISFAHGVGNDTRKARALKVAIMTTCGLGVASVVVMWIFSKAVSMAFLDPSCNAFGICVDGLPLFSLGFIVISLNIVMVGYYQSIESHKLATLFTLLRGFIFAIPCFILMPKIINAPGLWLALPIAEALTSICIVITYKFGKNR